MQTSVELDVFHQHGIAQAGGQLSGGWAGVRRPDRAKRPAGCVADSPFEPHLTLDEMRLRPARAGRLPRVLA